MLTYGEAFMIEKRLAMGARHVWQRCLCQLVNYRLVFNANYNEKTVEQHSIRC